MSYNYNNDQALRRSVMEDYAPEEWQIAYDFLKAGEIDRPQDEGDLPDGVYVCYTDGVKQPYDGENPTHNVSHIGVVARGHMLGIALASVGWRDMPSQPNGSESRNEFAALLDYDGAANTKDIKDVELAPSQWIPAVGELFIIFMNRDEIDKALLHVGGEPLAEKWYWSSTYSGNTYPWVADFAYGRLVSPSFKTIQTLRPVCKF